MELSPCSSIEVKAIVLNSLNREGERYPLIYYQIYYQIYC